MFKLGWYELRDGKNVNFNIIKCFYFEAQFHWVLNTLHLDYSMDFQLSILVHCNVFSPSSFPNVCVLFICICYKYFLHSSTKLYSFVMEFIIGMLSLQPLKHHQSLDTTRNHDF
jgi:hypothetical protein